MRTTNLNISECIKDIRTYYGYSRKEIANLLKITSATYSQYENNHRTIPINHINTLSNFYNLNIDYLLGLTDQKRNIIKGNLNLKIISTRLRCFRKKSNLKIEEVANTLNYAVSTLYRYESEKNLVSTSFCYDLARKRFVGFAVFLLTFSKKGAVVPLLKFWS